MQTALRTRTSAIGLLALLGTLLVLPIIVSWLGPPPRQEAYKSIPTRGGNVEDVVRAIYQSAPGTDVVFLGSSLVEAGVSRKDVAAALSDRLHRPSNVQILALNWPGLDLQYYMLRDFLASHQTRLIVWNPPEPHVRAYDYPHIQSYRWLRYGEYADARQGLSLQSRAALYGEMVIGAPRVLLSMLRPNLLGDRLSAAEQDLNQTGYYGATFQPEPLTNPNASLTLANEQASMFSVSHQPLGPYQQHFARLIVELARSHGATLVLLHIPTDREFGNPTIPELTDWKQQLGADLPILGAPAAELFAGMGRERYQHYFRDAHLNANGRAYFTRALISALPRAYEQGDDREGE